MAWNAVGWASGLEIELSIRWSGSTWTDVTEYLRAFSTDVPPSSSDDVHPPGRATFALDNRTGRFTPLYGSGAYQPNVVPGKHIRLKARYDSVSYNVWYGIIDDYGDSYPQARDGIATLTAFQPSVLLARYDVAPGGATAGPGEVTSDRVSRALTTAGWALSDSIETATTTMQATDSAGDQWSVAAMAARTEGGSLWCFYDTVYFDTRHGWWINTRCNTSQATFGSGGGEVPYHAEPPISTGFDWVKNQVTRGNRNGVAATVVDSASIAACGTERDTDVSLGGDLDSQSWGLATGFLIRRATPTNYPQSVTMIPNASPALCWPQAFGRQINDRVTVKVPRPWGDTLEQDCWVSGISHQASPGSWETTISLVPAGGYDGYDFAVVGTAIVGTSQVAY